MNRKNFLSFLGATPFAFKALIMESPEKVKEDNITTTKKEIRNKDIPQCLVMDKNGEKLALLSGITLSARFDDVFGRVIHKEWDVTFDNAEFISHNHNRLITALETKEIINLEIYYPGSEELFYVGRGRIDELSVDYSMMGEATANGCIMGVDESIAQVL